MIRRGSFNREKQPGSVTRWAIDRFAVGPAHDAGGFLCLFTAVTYGWLTGVEVTRDGVFVY